MIQDGQEVGVDMRERVAQLLDKLKGLTGVARRAKVEKEPKEVQRALRRAAMDAYFVPENLVSTHDPESSPSGRYRLMVSRYKTTDGSWNYTRGCVSRTEGDVLVADVRRNYSSFPFAWVEGHPNGYDYMLCGEDYQGQTVVELDTGRRVDHMPASAARGTGFCWAAIHPNADGTLIAVEGCHWACPYETVIYDFAEPMSPPWIELVRGEPDFGGWTGLDRCTIGQAHEVVQASEDAPDEFKALNGRKLDDLDEAQTCLLDAEEARTGKEPLVSRLEGLEWVRPPLVKVAHRFMKDYLGWYHEQHVHPEQYGNRSVAPEDVLDVTVQIERMLERLGPAERVALQADPEVGPLLAWWTVWKRTPSRTDASRS